MESDCVFDHSRYFFFFFFAEPNTNFLALVCYSSLCFLRLWYFKQFLNHLTYHAEQIKAKFVPCSSSFLVMDSMVILFYYYYFFNLENLFLFCFLFVCSKDSSCIYDLIILLCLASYGLLPKRKVLSFVNAKHNYIYIYIYILFLYWKCSIFVDAS